MTSSLATTVTDPNTTRKPKRRTKPTPTPRVSRGHKLLCIDDRGFHRNYTPGPPIKGHVYCVRDVYEDGGRAGVLLAGIIGPTPSNGLEQVFFLTRFRWVHD